MNQLIHDQNYHQKWSNHYLQVKINNIMEMRQWLMSIPGYKKINVEGSYQKKIFEAQEKPWAVHYF